MNYPRLFTFTRGQQRTIERARQRQALEDILARHRHPSGDGVTAQIAARALGVDA